MKFKLDQLTGWYTMGQLAKSIKTAIFFARNGIFVTFELVIMSNLKVNVLLNCANCISQKKFHARIF